MPRRSPLFILLYMFVLMCTDCEFVVGGRKSRSLNQSHVWLSQFFRHVQPMQQTDTSTSHATGSLTARSPSSPSLNLYTPCSKGPPPPPPPAQDEDGRERPSSAARSDGDHRGGSRDRRHEGSSRDRDKDRDDGSRRCDLSLLLLSLSLFLVRALSSPALFLVMRPSHCVSNTRCS